MRVVIFAYTGELETLQTGVTKFNLDLVSSLVKQYPEINFELVLADGSRTDFENVSAPNLTKRFLSGQHWREGRNSSDSRLRHRITMSVREWLSRIGIRYFLMRSPFLELVSSLAKDDVVLYTVYGAYAEFPIVVARCSDARLVSFVHDIRQLVRPQAPSRWLVWREKQILKFICTESDLVIVPSTHIAHELASRWGDKLNVEIGYSVPQLPESRGALKEISDVFGRRRYSIFFPSTIVETKNHRELIRSIQILTARGLDVQLVLCGSNTESTLWQELCSFTRLLQIQDRVVHLGFVDEAAKAQCYSLASVVAVPSIGESFSLPIWEAFGLGCPVVASTDRDIPEQVSDAGLLANPADAWEIADVISVVLLDEDVRKRLIEAGKSRYRDSAKNALLGSWCESVFAGES